MNVGLELGPDHSCCNNNTTVSSRHTDGSDAVPMFRSRQCMLGRELESFCNSAEIGVVGFNNMKDAVLCS